MTDNNLVTDNADSPSAIDGNVSNREFDSVSLDGNFDAFRASLERQGVRTDHVEARAIEERELTEDDFYNNDYKESGEFQGTVEEVQEVPAEELDSDDNSDVDSDIEADDATDDDEVTDPIDVNENADIDVLSYDDLFNQVGKIEIGGELYSPAQLKSILGQEVSAGTKAREAAERVKELDARAEKLDAEQAWLEQRKEAAVQSDEMARLQREYASIQEKVKGMDPQEDLYEVSLAREQMARIGERYNELHQEVSVVQQRADAEKAQKAAAELKAAGYDYLVSDQKKSKAWLNYASGLGMSQAELHDAARTPSVAIAIEKARQWDAAQSKDTKKLTSTAKAPRSSGRIKQTSQAQKDAKQVSRIKSGQASRAEIEAFLMKQGRETF